MLAKQTFEFVESTAPITEPVTKFGGQPVWINTPKWPIDSYAPMPDVKMLFIGQITLNPTLFPVKEGMMAYIFFSEGEPLIPQQIVIVLQTKDNACVNTVFNTEGEEIEFVEEATGDSIYLYGASEAHGTQKVPKEYQVELSAISKDEYFSTEQAPKNEDEIFANPNATGNKIGGQPAFFHHSHPEFYTADDWFMLLQFTPPQQKWQESRKDFLPFVIYLYPGTILQIFVSKDLQQAVAFLPFD